MDGAGPFLRTGARAVVLLDADTVQGQADVVSIHTDSRYRDPEQAAVRTAAAVRAAVSADLLVKTVEFTLRGNVDTEVRAALRVGGRPVAIVAPAFPAEGRTTVEGTQLGNGVPVHETVFASDRRSPAALSDLRAIIPGTRVMPAATDLPTETGIWIAGASTDAELDAFIARADDPAAGALGRVYRRRGRAGEGSVDRDERTKPPSRGPARAPWWVGSRHTTSLGQVRTLAGQDAIDAGSPQAAALISRRLRSRNLAVITGPQHG